MNPTCTVTLLPEADTHVDPANPTMNFAGQPLVVSAEHNETRQVAYVRFDLGPIDPTAAIMACQLYFTVEGTVTKQIVKLLLVDDDTWADTISFETAPKPSEIAIGTWLVETTPRATTNAINPVLAGVVQRKHAGQDCKLSLQISSTFGQQGVLTPNTYVSFEGTATGEPASAPRLVVQYEPAPRPLAREWRQRQADARHSGRSPWQFANTPTKSYIAEPVLSGVQLNSQVVIRDELLYLFTPDGLQVVDPARAGLKSLQPGSGFFTLALGPNGLLYAAAKNELAGFDLAAEGNKTISVPLNNSSEITAGVDGSVYLAQGSTLFAYVQHLGSLVPAWSKDMATDLLSQVTLSADGSTAYIAATDGLYALNAADGSEQWKFMLPSRADHLTTPVAGSANGLSYFGVDDTLYVFLQNKPKLTIPGNGPVSQPLIDSEDTLYVLQGDGLYTVGRHAMSASKAVTIGTSATVPVEPVMDGAGNVFIIDNQKKLFVCDRDLNLSNVPQTLTFVFGDQPSLQVAPNGSLFCRSGSALYRLKPDVNADVTVSSYADATSYRAASSLVLEGAAVPAAASVVFQSAGTITIEPGFSLPVGSEAVFNTGY